MLQCGYAGLRRFKQIEPPRHGDTEKTKAGEERMQRGENATRRECNEERPSPRASLRALGVGRAVPLIPAGSEGAAPQGQQHATRLRLRAREMPRPDAIHRPGMI